MRGQRCRSLLETARGGGWSGYGRRCASAGDGPAQIWMQSTVKSRRGNAPEHGEDMGTEKRRQGHLGASESTNLAAALRSSDEGFAQPGGALLRGIRGERRGEWGLFIGVTRC
jgi:hypothetical protein